MIWRNNGAFFGFGFFMKIFLLRATKACVAFSLLLPLIALPQFFIFPFIVPRIIFFRSLVLLMLLGYSLLLVVDWQEYRARLTPITAVVGLFFVSLSISTFFGVDWYRSFWDNHERMLGLFTLLHYGLYYVIATTIMRRWEEWRRLFRMFLCVGIIVMIVGIIQTIEPDFFLNKGNHRVSSTLGNPIYYSGFGLFLFFLGAFLFTREQTRTWKCFAALGAIFGFVGIFLGGTRGTILGLLGGMAVALFSYVVLLQGHPQVRRALNIAMGIGAVAVLLLVVFRHTSFVERLPGVGSLVQTSISGGTARTRIMAWGIALDAWKERPMFGWGPNNYYYAFNAYYRPEFMEYGVGETWFDNAHNVLLNTLAVQGLFGFIMYGALFIVPVVILLAYRKKFQYDIHAVVLGMSFLIAHLIHNVFVFENPTSYLFFFLFLAFLNAQTSLSRQTTARKEQKKISPVRVSQGFMGRVAGAGLLVFVLFVATDVYPARANMAMFKMMRTLYTESDPLSRYESVLALPTPHRDDIRNDFAHLVFPLIQETHRRGNSAYAKDIFDRAVAGLEANRELHPLDVRIHLELAELYQRSAPLFQEASFFTQAEAVLEDARLKSPRRQQIDYMLAGIEFQLNKPDEAILHLRVSIDDNPNIVEGWWRLAFLLEYIGRHNEALGVLEESKTYGVVFHGQAADIAHNILSATSS
ncbi:MAG TPA: hypothetical protein DCY48_04700 [Candidatus Magasanikbacteria bacterium]|nr:MAG: hypothetical protein A3I74_03190 [Candidatus Magasanikbacteria bacterium RIFCSPLOWO2_02_FULL_47_16]OGH80216.1 MAG: hypothetical protein A3C10_03470 [Candidatus Magasanikbacteria bacterium RIFCSPHIGHO2_02_FULL_48_18]OGH82709.1 MAG: hypothetical protein A3G08_01485 [Candidatus Magasanikbacteria bacterium RIFCSPLOWO2_12_FULL_47_9b]HAZ29041.1 hypothetical protein [Candidatus Magasanikbacteria bacterium]